MNRFTQACALCACLMPLSNTLRAQDSTEIAAADDAPTLGTMNVVGERSYEDRHPLPPSAASIEAPAIADKVNLINTEDALKYLPDLMVRKRYIGDAFAPLATRTTGINASARTLIYADGMLLSSLIANNNGNGSPQWYIVAPNEIERIDVLYGPYSAMYAGNSYGAVVNITTRMPTAFEAGGKVTTSFDDFGKYGTHGDFRASETSAGVGDRSGAFSWRVSANHLDSRSQPVTYLTLTQSTVADGSEAPVGGGYADRNRTGAGIQVLGAGNLTHTLQDNATLKLAYDFSDTLRAAYTAAYWQNDADLTPQTYLTDAGGAPYFGGASGTVAINGYRFNASSVNALFTAGSAQQRHLAQALSLTSRTQGAWDWNATLGHFDYLKDLARTSTTAFPNGVAGGAGRIVDAGGTGWDTLDAGATWRPQGIDGSHFVSFGIHGDRYDLESPTYTATDWKGGDEGALFTSSNGKTATGALWAQDMWRMLPTLAATVGARYETWRAYDGAIGISQDKPALHSNGVSPKLMLAWDALPQLQLDLSAGRALRFPTAGELYQAIGTGAAATQPNPNLKPEEVRSAELAGEWHIKDRKLRLTVFEERVRDALISQTNNVSNAPVSFVQNVDRTRQRGVELSGEAQNLGLQGFELSGNVTYVDARILKNSNYQAPATIPGATSVGKTTPYVPRLRSTLGATYKPDERWAYTLAGRYSSRLYATVDNTDVYTHTYQGFDPYFVMDARVNCRLTKQWSVAAGVNNLLDREYLLFHSFEQRTLFAELKVDL